MEKREIVNIISFIRGCEPRSDVDLVQPVVEQTALLKRHGLKATFLVQYDALIREDFQDILKRLDPEQFEIGVWLELPQQLVEKAGLKWTGAQSWDWHSHCGFSVGYDKDAKHALVDVLFNDFRETFGYYPKTLGSWAFDAEILAYACDKYGIVAACSCKDQWGTDGYSLWGGYYGQGYYPSRFNAFAPAQREENQINVPVFRMLGSDPIYQYDYGFYNEGEHVQGVITLEPVYCGADGGGGVPAWVDWYMRENFNGKCLSFGYAQAGQENSFGWDAMKSGLTYQYALFEKLAAQGKITAERLCDTGKWYRETYSSTPASAITAESDWRGEGRKSVWYSSKNYRVNFYVEDGGFYIRDMFLFRDEYRERYLNGGCVTDALTYDNLPVMDVRLSGSGVRSGIYPSAEGSEAKPHGMKFDEMNYSEKDGSAVLTFTGTEVGDVTFTLSEDGITVSSAAPVRFTAFTGPDAEKLVAAKASDDKVSFTYNGFDYGISIEKTSVPNGWETKVGVRP